MKRIRTIAMLVAGLTLATAAAPVAEAGRWHRRGHGHRSAVIVIGTPQPVRQVVVINGRPHGSIDLNVTPKATLVYVDGKLRGNCGNFDGHPGKLNLLPGRHSIKLVTPDGISVEREVRIKAGVEINVGLDLG